MKKSLLILFVMLQVWVNAQTPGDYINTGSKSVPFPLHKNYKWLTHYLCRGAGSEEEKAWRIYSWEAHHIKYDIKAAQKGRVRSIKPSVTLWRRKAVCDGYSKLFLAMCKEAGLEALRIEGYSKDFYFDPGDCFYKDGHSWNAVKLSGKWYLIDVTYGAGGVEPKPMPLRTFLRKLVHLPSVRHVLRFKRDFSPIWFCSDPAFFMVSHAPDDPMWQMLTDEENLHRFEGVRLGKDSMAELEKQPVGILGMENPQADGYVKSDELSKIVVKADNGYEYNLRNNKLKAYKEMALADTFYNAAGRKGKNPEEQILSFERAQEHSREAIQYLGCQRSDIAEEYKFLRAKNLDKNRLALKEIKTLSDTNNRNMRTISRISSANRTRIYKIRSLLRREGLIESRINAHTLEKVKAGKKTPAHDSLIARNNDSIIQNRHRIDSLQACIKVLDQQREALKDLYQAMNPVLQSDLFAGIGLVTEAIQLRIKMADNYKKSIRSLESQLDELKLQEKADFRKGIEQGAGGASEAGAQIERQIASIRLQFNSSLKFIKLNKKLGADPDSQNETYRKENDLLREITDQMRDVLYRERNLLKNENAGLAQDYKRYSKQNNLLWKETRTENERRKQEDRRLKKMERSELARNTQDKRHSMRVNSASKKNAVMLRKMQLKSSE
ncbi:MAG TPA: transglutaminase domain-containing protein [Bacteroidia bacterium]|nr:transglutaminase domain-containing protein [Bacteroidia bacterium]